MAIELQVAPREVVMWERFSKDYPHFSIALDGFCSGPTRSSIGGRRLNLNHHEGEDPIAVLTRTLNDILLPSGWTSPQRDAARVLTACPIGSLDPTLVQALQTLQPLLNVLGADPSTRFRTPMLESDEDIANRMAIRSTTDQAICQIKLGLYDTYQVDGEPTAILWVNDCDEDVVFATYILMHPEAVDDKCFREIAKMEDYLDMSAGLFPVRKREHVLRKLCWITNPYTKAKLSGELFTMDATAMKDLILRMHDRIRRTLQGRGRETEPETGYDVLFDHGFWKVVRETGAHARFGLSADGVKAFISVRSEVPGHYRYVAARLSKFIPIPLVTFAEFMNDLEGIGPDSPDRWGGSDTVIGSPRLAGTRFNPAEMSCHLEDFIRHHQLERYF